MEKKVIVTYLAPFSSMNPFRWILEERRGGPYRNLLHRRLEAEEGLNMKKSLKNVLFHSIIKPCYLFHQTFSWATYSKGSCR